MYFMYERISIFCLGSTWAMGPSGSKIKYKNIFTYEVGVTPCVSSSRQDPDLDISSF